jgi:DNA-binding NarL/FixJ family response regulator
MPRMDGVAAAREIKRQYPDVKIIGLSEHAPGYNVHAMESAGVVGVYLKSKEGGTAPSTKASIT